MLANGILELARVLQQFDHMLEQTTSAATVDAAMIKAKRDLCFSSGDKLLFVFVPERNLFPDAET